MTANLASANHPIVSLRVFYTQGEHEDRFLNLGFWFSTSCFAVDLDIYYLMIATLLEVELKRSFGYLKPESSMKLM